MLKHLLYSGLLLLCVSCADSPKTQELQKENDDISFNENTALTQDISAYKTVVNVIRETGLAQNFVILPGNVKNVEAYIKNNERILEYNPNFMRKLQGDTNWYGISVLARQIGHHLSNHELKGGKATPEEEIEADKYAGFVLHKMGASLDQAISAMEDVLKDPKNPGTVNGNDRISAITKGWKEAQILSSETLIAGTDPKKKDSVVAIAMSQTASNQPKNPDYKYQVFLALDTTFYYIDKKNEIFVEKKGKYLKVGEKRESTKPGFDWIFVKGADTYGVDLKGRLWAFTIEGNFHVVGQALKMN